MPGERHEPGRPAEERRPREPAPEPAGPAAGGLAAPRARIKIGLRAWLPLGGAVVGMPALAYAVTVLVLVPHFQKALQRAGAAPAESEAVAPAASSPESASHPNQTQSMMLNKLLVNVAGTMGSRYLLASITVMGEGADFRARFTEKEAQLRDKAGTLLESKTIADLEKPGARNVLRSELLAGFNTILGQPGAQEIYFTEFAIQ